MSQLTATDIKIIAQNAGTSAGVVYAALISSGQVTWDKDAFPAQIEALRSVFVAGVTSTVAEAVANGDAVAAPAPAPEAPRAAAKPFADQGATACPSCAGPMWDNREGKRNPKAPDFKCKDKACADDPDNPGVIWPPRNAR